MRFLSLCSGIEAASVAWKPLGWTPVAFSEIEPFPNALLAHHYPDVPNLGDMTNYDQWSIDEPIDLICGGTPCFPADTPIITSQGIKPIEQVSVGDYVWTHKHRWRKVLAVGNKQADTIKVKGYSCNQGLETTKEHPIYATEKSRVWDNSKRGYVSVLSHPEWVDAEHMTGKFWAIPSQWDDTVPPDIVTQGNEVNNLTIDEKLAWVIGRWLGDGWCRINNRRGYVLIACGKHKADELRAKLTDLGAPFNEAEQRTSIRFSIANRAFARWLVENFGHGAERKQLPVWVFGWKYRKHLLDGYLSADGHHTSNGFRAITVSKYLALGLVLLITSLGYGVSRQKTIPSSTKVIEGRTVNQRPYYTVTAYTSSRSSTEKDGHRWGLVRNVSPGRRTTVYNIEVEEDNSYVADGITVHNCQAFSVAGQRKSLDDERGNLSLTFCRVCDKFDPDIVIWENVPGVLNTKDNAFGCFLAELAGLDEPVKPRKHPTKFDSVGIVNGQKRCVAWRVLDAQYFGVPQRRRRVFVVAFRGAGNWRGAATLFPIAESVRRSTTPSRSARSGTAGFIETGFADYRESIVAGTTKASGGALGGGSETFVVHGSQDPGVNENFANPVGRNNGLENVVIVDDQGGSSINVKKDGITGTLRAEAHGNLPVIALAGNTINRSPEQGGNGSGFDDSGVSYTLTTNDIHGVVAWNGDVTPKTSEDVSLTLRAQQGGEGLGVAYAVADVAPTLTTGFGERGMDLGQMAGGGAVLHSNALPTIVRRLTPKECERLQGFPDDYTKIPYRGKPAEQCPDAPRYKALGNSWAVPVVRWIGERINQVKDM